MIIPNNWENKKCSKPPTSYENELFLGVPHLRRPSYGPFDLCESCLLGNWSDFDPSFDILPSFPFGAFLKWGYPQIIHFRFGLSLMNHPFLGTPNLGNPHFVRIARIARADRWPPFLPKEVFPRLSQLSFQFLHLSGEKNNSETRR